MRIDAHHHLWRYTPEEYGWIDETLHRLRRDFLVEELADEAADASVRATVAVQARQSLQETEWLLDVSRHHPLIAGVVGWAPIADDEFSALLEALKANPLLKGLRHIVQAEPDGFLHGSGFNRVIAAMRDTGLVYDLLVYARQLDQAIRFVDRHPQQIFVLDHIAKPEIANDCYESWASSLRELARRENVICKLSGMVTEADWKRWTPDALQPYFDTVLDAFSPARIMVGSDWPVLTVATSYARWWQVVESWIAPLSENERAQMESGTAQRIYRLAPHENKQP